MRRATSALVLLFATALAGGDTFTVTNNGDSGAGSLRQAIDDANANPGADTIEFNIPGAGVHTITAVTNLPQITDSVTIDGYTQPGSSVNTDPIATNAVLLIEVHGTNNIDGTGLSVGSSAGGTALRGLVINGWWRGVALNGPGSLVTGNFIGTDPTGTLAVPNGSGVFFNGTDLTTVIGGTAPADRNLISGNFFEITTAKPGPTIQGNLIGTDPTGMLAVSHASQGGIWCGGTGTPGATIGGTDPGAGNVISGQSFWGIRLETGSGHVVQGNRIGTNAAGTGPVGNYIGIRLQSSGNTIGGTTSGESNVIAYNSGPGISLEGSSGDFDNRIRGNSIHGNGGLGIDIYPTGPDFNDPLDADEGQNHLQNFPIIETVTIEAPQAGTRIQGELNSAPSTTFDLDFYSNPACPDFPRELLEGETYLGSSQVTTDGSGNATIDVTLAATIQPGERVSATATDPDGNTSEFSQRIAFSIDPPSGPASGGTAFTISGTDFVDPTTVTVGGIAPAAVTFTDDHTLDATMPAFPPGTSQDVVVTTPDGTTGTIIKGWVADFLDVPGGHQFYSYVTSLVSNGVTAGAGSGLFNVDNPTLRQQMAVFLLKAKHGLCYTPPPCTTALFTDVHCSSGFAPWIYALVDEGITGGCGNGTTFCPTNPVLRQQMAVFLLKAFEPSGYAPPACSGAYFVDVPCFVAPGVPNLFAPWIYELAFRQVSGGCGNGRYCPTDPATRGQMAVFLVKTFGLQ